MRNKFARLRHPENVDTEKFSDRKKRIYQFLRENPVGVLSMVTPDGNPHGVVVYFTVDSGFTISFLTKSGTRKYDNLVHNDRVHLTVYEPSTQAIVQVDGHAVEIRDRRRVDAVAGHVLGATLRTSESGVPPITKLDAGSYAAFDILPYQARMAVYARPDSGTYDEIFESIESFDLD